MYVVLARREGRRHPHQQHLTGRLPRDNLRIQVNVPDAALQRDVERVRFLGPPASPRGSPPRIVETPCSWASEADDAYPTGTPQKLLDVSKLAEAGWTSRVGLEEGLERTMVWYREHVGDLRGYGDGHCVVISVPEELPFHAASQVA
jgi:hypothetical protein